MANANEINYQNGLAMVLAVAAYNSAPIMPDLISPDLTDNNWKTYASSKEWYFDYLTYSNDVNSLHIWDMKSYGGSLYYRIGSIEHNANYIFEFDLETVDGYKNRQDYGREGRDQVRGLVTFTNDSDIENESYGAVSDMYGKVAMTEIFTQTEGLGYKHYSATFNSGNRDYVYVWLHFLDVWAVNSQISHFRIKNIEFNKL